MACVTNIHRPKLLVVEPGKGQLRAPQLPSLQTKRISQDGYQASWAYPSLGYPQNKPITQNPA